MKFRKEVRDEVVAFLRAKVKVSKKELFSYFYPLDKLHKLQLKQDQWAQTVLAHLMHLGSW